MAVAGRTLLAPADLARRGGRGGRRPDRFPPAPGGGRVPGEASVPAILESARRAAAPRGGARRGPERFLSVSRHPLPGNWRLRASFRVTALVLALVRVIARRS